MTAPRPTTIMLCDDSPTYVTALRRFLEYGNDLQVVATCSSGEEAVARLATIDPALVIMDLELPGADGIVSIRRMMQAQPVPILLLSANTRRGSPTATNAIVAGALDVAWKNDVPVTDPAGARAIAFRRYVKRLAAARPARSDRPAAPARPITARPQAAVSVIGIAASTGGPLALREVVGALPRAFDIPILVVQHIATGFLDGLITWLDSQVPIPIRRAVDGQPPLAGVWFAPDDAHLVLDQRGRLRFDHDTMAGYHRPAADLLFTSMAHSAGPAAAAVVLTGMGSDGADGLAAVRAAGGATFAQDRQSSVIYGMPRAAAQRGAQHVLPPAAIGDALSRMRPSR